jgi:hypothetical protein
VVRLRKEIRHTCKGLRHSEAKIDVSNQYFVLVVFIRMGGVINYSEEELYHLRYNAV